MTSYFSRMTSYHPYHPVDINLSGKLNVKDQGLILWFILTGSIHIFFEGYFVYNHARMASRTDFFGQLWKEYALSDSRYMSSDSFLLTIESMDRYTLGPALLPHRRIHHEQFPIPIYRPSTCFHREIYGNLLYLATSLLNEYTTGRRYYRPEPLYFWVYFILINSIWLFVPGFALYDSIIASARSFEISDPLIGGKTHAKTQGRHQQKGEGVSQSSRSPRIRYAIEKRREDEEIPG
ncbi:hypothetical protein DID88_006143 [Monilinia fructigena]|uniref:EXPERA domain-containing protein n=1 Tax=Monilinia fructigena TaxID=38457 RepID=A0A395J492_9HELO|nr:hypothetical protein DID88_006143 [Monilinia fructigena]